MRLLLIEDDTRLAEMTAEYLREHDAEVEVASDGESGLSRARTGEHDLVLLDLMLPKLGGIEVCKQLRGFGSHVPIIMLTARGDEVDRVVGLELGADDYVSKPFSPRELLARIRSVLRRAPAHDPERATSVQAGPLCIDRERRSAQLHSERLELTAYQFDLLWVLALHQGRVLPRARLHDQVRALRGDPPVDFDPSVDRSIDVHLSKIRSALDTAHPDGKGLIQTVRGVGYVLGPPR